MNLLSNCLKNDWKVDKKNLGKEKKSTKIGSVFQYGAGGVGQSDFRFHAWMTHSIQKLRAESLFVGVTWQVQL